MEISKDKFCHFSSQLRFLCFIYWYPNYFLFQHTVHWPLLKYCVIQAMLLPWSAPLLLSNLEFVGSWLKKISQVHQAGAGSRRQELHLSTCLWGSYHSQAAVKSHRSGTNEPICRSSISNMFGYLNKYIHTYYIYMERVWSFYLAKSVPEQFMERQSW